LLKDSNRIIEKTIRQIKESQAEKEKTRDLRQQLEEFKSAVIEESPVSETRSEITIAKLDSMAKKIKILPKTIDEKKEQKSISEQPLRPGDAVRMIETMAAGEVIEIKEKMVQIETGSLRFYVPVEKIERISRSELMKNLRATQPVRENDPGLVQRNISFKPEIDIRGMRGEEAINQVRELLDNALIVQHRHLRILHGKGNGILRLLVRQYLDTVDIVKSFRDEHVEFGGSGITVVEMDF